MLFRSASKFIPDGVYDMVASTTENSLICLSTQEDSSMFVYKWHWSGREKMQSAWFKYTFNGLEILNAEFIESALYVVGNKSGKTILYKINFDEGRSDTDQDYVTRLDHRITEADCTVTYDSVANTTTFTIPFELSNPAVVTRGTTQGEIIPVTSSTSTQVVVSGDKSASNVYLGERYTMRYEFSEPTLKEDTPAGGRVAIAGGRLQIKHWLMRYQDSGEFDCKVESKVGGNTAQTYSFTGRLIGGGENIIGDTVLTSGDFRFPVMIKSVRAKITIESDSHLPCQFLSAEWEGNLHLRSNRR